MKKTLIVTISSLCAACFLISGGYGTWEKSIVFTGKVDVAPVQLPVVPIPGPITAPIAVPSPVPEASSNPVHEVVPNPTSVVTPSPAFDAVLKPAVHEASSIAPAQNSFPGATGRK